MDGRICSVDVASLENLNDLVEIGEKLLGKPVSQVNFDTGVYEPCSHETNAEALKRYLLEMKINYKKNVQI